MASKSVAKRKKIKRSMAQAHHNLDRALEAIQGVHGIFEPTHPQHAELLEMIARSMLMTQELIMSFWQAAWGGRPSNIDTYRG